MTNDERLAAVSPELADRVRKLIALAAADGFTLTIVQGLRTVAEQDALYAQGRTKPGKKVTNARGGQSMHNFGIAADLAFIIDGKISWDDKLYSNIGKWAKEVNLDWGGGWKKFVDRPHVQIPNLPSYKVIMPVFKQGGLAAVWAKFK